MVDNPVPKEQVEAPIPHGDDGVLGELDGVGARLGPCQLGEDYAGLSINKVVPLLNDANG